MKKKLLLSLFLILCISAIAQTTIEGTYQLKIVVTNADIQRTLTLNPDGTFLFHGYENIQQGIPQEKNFYGKGTWTSDKNLIYFVSSQNDFDEKYKLDFNNTKARFDTKSPRDKSNRDIKTTLRFYESEILWVKGIVLLKTE